MNRFGSPSEDHQPLTWFRGYPVYVTHVIMATYVASMIVTSVLMAANVAAVFNWLRFDSALVFKGQVWRFLSYGLWNPPSINFAINMLFLTIYGREVEKFFGRATFVRFYVLLYLMTPVAFSIFGIWWPMGWAGETGALAVFVAFATLFPGVEMMFGVLAKWAAYILVGIYTLMWLSSHNNPALISLWATVGFAYLFVRHQQDSFSLPDVPMFRRKTHLRVLRDDEVEVTSVAKTSRSDAMAEVDALLDKIATSGIGSLTNAERAKLDRARDDLKKRDSTRR
ncbi:MAG TPA: rhomboid family intramembrane serine protease [Opitutaceae bacterium]|nr:rhomboid family intramembrane serine protease [Opitutaceae bacterium]